MLSFFHQLLIPLRLSSSTSAKLPQPQSQWWNSLTLCSTNVIPSFSAVSKIAWSI